MIKLFTSTLLFSFCVFSFNLKAQNNLNESISDSNVSSFEKNDESHPCITPQEYTIIERRCNENLALLNLHSARKSNVFTTQLSWPVRAAAGLNDYSYYFIAAYVDENPAAGSFSDYSCGTNSYDGHKGTDIAIWPFGFYKMDNSQVEVVAAAAGTIIDKGDGNFDRNCSSNSLPANYVVIQHADSSRALYWHMKKNSVTSKAIGQTVVAGEYLGAVGSSGSASGPHLHFEIWRGSTTATYNDPFYGNCNVINNASWWTAQKPHAEPAVIKVSVNTTDIVLPGCPTTETPNESNSFSIPFQGAGLPAGYAKFYIFIRNETSGMTAECRILNPNGTVFNSWTYNSTADNKTNIRGWSKLLPAVFGTYTFEVTYNSIVCSKTFEITGPTKIDSPEPAALKIYPNPSNGKLFVAFENKNAITTNGTIEFYNVLGAKVFESEISNSNSEIKPEIESGVYFYMVKDNDRLISSGKIIFQ